MNFENQTMIHIGAEVLLFGGLVFWSKKRLDAADQKIEELEERLAKYEQMFMHLQEGLTKHDNALRQIYGMPPNPRGPEQSGSPNPVSIRSPGDNQHENRHSPTQNPREGQNAAEGTSTGTSSGTPSAASMGNTKNPGQTTLPARHEGAEVQTKHEPDISPEDLDKILEEELRQNSAGESEVTLEIDTQIEKRVGGSGRKTSKKKISKSRTRIANPNV